jgi:hypothetical protein
MCKISQEAIYDILAKTNIFIIKNSRICGSHLDEKGFLVDRCLNDIISLEGSVFLLGLKKNEFLYIFGYVNSKLNNSQIRTKEHALFIYLLCTELD